MLASCRKISLMCGATSLTLAGLLAGYCAGRKRSSSFHHHSNVASSHDPLVAAHQDIPASSSLQQQDYPFSHKQDTKAPSAAISSTSSSKPSVSSSVQHDRCVEHCWSHSMLQATQYCMLTTRVLMYNLCCLELRLLFVQVRQDSVQRP